MPCHFYYGPFLVQARPGLGLAGEPGKEDREAWDEQTQERALARSVLWVAWCGATLIS